VVVVAGQQRLQKDGSIVRVVDTSKAQGGPAGGPPGGKPGGAPNAAPNATRPADKAAPQGGARAAQGKGPQAQAPAGENPCTRGMNAAR
jgi:membrane fusion protein, multidrug efflux system